jgi:hypothetical protein
MSVASATRVLPPVDREQCAGTRRPPPYAFALSYMWWCGIFAFGDFGEFLCWF